jgi:hypothetical protein
MWKQHDSAQVDNAYHLLENANLPTRHMPHIRVHPIHHKFPFEVDKELCSDSHSYIKFFWPPSQRAQTISSACQQQYVDVQRWVTSITMWRLDASSEYVESGSALSSDDLKKSEPWLKSSARMSQVLDPTMTPSAGDWWEAEESIVLVSFAIFATAGLWKRATIAVTRSEKNFHVSEFKGLSMFPVKCTWGRNAVSLWNANYSMTESPTRMMAVLPLPLPLPPLPAVLAR